MSLTTLSLSENPEIPSADPITTQAVYDTPAGHTLARRILFQLLQFSVHDYQIYGICAVMDGLDLVATMATGGVKTGYFIMLMFVVHAISRDTCVALRNVLFLKDPGLIIICPTKALQEDMASKMVQFGLLSTI
ncbi:hypothetical protein DXG03_007954 [Asterophora parasitica]|uniref:Uncharacterized protein n=1 Tax=Asterophora parasitica TaxID=117018 RepID=A0A9P7K8Z1_9AGAR|nr:hypothetical protein DXG03_007954 [Asterophora parasitica]